MLERCLRRFGRAWPLSAFVANLKGLKNSGPALPELAVPAVPTQLARYVYESRNFFKETRKPRPAAFYPELFQGRWETSVCGRDGVSEERIWTLATTARPDKRLYGRFDFATKTASDEGLTCERAPMESFPEHAVLLGWPDPGAAKEAWKLLAVRLGNRCSAMLQPPGGPREP